MVVLDGRQPEMVGVSVALLVAATVSGFLRLLARHVMHAGFWWDDWCSLFALFLSYSLNIVQFVCVTCDLGLHTQDLSDPEESIKCFLKALFSVTQFYAFCMPFIKATMVLFYWRLFHSNRNMRLALLIAGAMLIAWNIGALFSGIFQCRPISRIWDKSIPGYCIDSLVYFRAIAGTNLITDLYILFLPLPIVSGLRRPFSEKVALMGIFTLGTFVSLISIIRIVILTSPNDPDPLWDSAPGTIWTSVETSVGVICVNLVTMSPLFRKYILRRNVQPRKQSDSYPTPRKALYGSGSRSRPRGSAESTSPFETDENVAGSRRTILVQTDWDVTMQDGHGVELQCGCPGT